MDETAAAGIVGLIGIVIIVGLLLVLIPFIFYLISLQRCFNAVRPEFRPSLPVGLIWLSLVPALGFVVLLTAIIMLSTSLQKEDEARGSKSFGDGGLSIGLAAVILGFLSWIPFLGILLAIASLVCWIMHWIKIAGFRKILDGQAPAVVVAPASVFAPAAPIPAAFPAAPPAPAPAPAPASAMVSDEATMLFASVGQAKLVCVVGAVQGMSFPVGNGVTIGRSSEAEVVVPDPQISNRHAWVGVLNNQLVLRDLKSTNGTYLNDNLAAPIQEQVLKDGDVIVLGKHNQMKFRVTLA